MNENKAVINSIDEYILKFPADIQMILEKLRQVIKDAAPEAEEKISYNMPTFYLNGNLVHFAAYKNHIGFYPAPTGIEKFKDELSIYKGGKGS
ncbi:MAG: iron chaperone, partial [Sedimentibacter sp.]